MHKYADDYTIDEIWQTEPFQTYRSRKIKWWIGPMNGDNEWISFSQSSPEPPPIQTDRNETERVNTFKLPGVWND
jgi:hypothetical protein